MEVSFSQKRSKLTIDPKSLDIETVKKLLLRRDININTIFHRTSSDDKKRTTFLHAAIEDNNVELINWLIAKKVDLNIRIPNIGLPINVAISKSDLATVKKLVSSGARLNFRDPKSGDSVLFWASLYANTQIAEYLIENGADVNMELTKRGYFNGFSPLQFYAERGNVQVTKLTKLLLSKGANVNYKSIDGSTPLVFAVQSGNLKVIKLLIEHGADINCTYQKFNDVVSILHIAMLSLPQR